jgi:hypothetical protein
MGSWSSRSGECQISDSKIWSLVLLNSDPKMTAQATSISNCEQQTRLLFREGATSINPHLSDLNRYESQMGAWHHERLRIHSWKQLLLESSPSVGSCYQASVLKRWLFSYCRLTLYIRDSVALVLERTVPTERPLLVGKVSVNFHG